MKPKEFITKYHLEEGWKSKNQEKFIKDMTSEFKVALEYFKSEENIRGFEQAVKVVSDKWQSISNKIPYGIPDGVWSFFYATVVAPMREELCPKEMERRRSHK